MMETTFTPFLSLAGGALIGLASLIFMLTNGRVAGISGILSKNLPPESDRSTTAQDVMFLIGLFAAPFLLVQLTDMNIIQTVTDNILLLGAAGFFVGLGAVIGNGCTSGHGVCGLSLFSVRSLIATLTFMGVAFGVVAISRHVMGG